MTDILDSAIGQFLCTALFALAVFGAALGSFVYLTFRLA
jgi:hypothetical protein